MEIIWNIVQFAIIFSVLLFVHEGGHFIMCRLARVPVEEFGFGLPPRIIKLFTWQGTVFSINALPFGAFVRPRGEVDRLVEGGLANASPIKKLGVYFGGPISNLLLGLLLLFILFFQLGTPDTSKVLITGIAQGSPADLSGLTTGDQVISINGSKINSIEDMQISVTDNLGKPIQIEVIRNNEALVMEATPRVTPPENQGALGVVLSNPYYPVSIGEAFKTAVHTGYRQMAEFVLLPGRLMTGAISSDQSRVVGIKGIYDMYTAAGNLDADVTSDTTQRAPLYRLYFIATISIALGLTNLLPIPALDGGRIVLVMPELILRRRIPQKVENYLISISFMALLLLMIIITYQDFVNPINLP